jgi:hypothetical protein
LVNDNNAPDFISDLIEEELITTKIPDLMEKFELKILNDRKRDFYNKNVMIKLLEIIPFSNPQIVLLDEIS